MDKHLFAKKSILLISNSFIKLFCQIIVLIIFAKHLSVDDYGLYQTVWMYVNIISVILLFGLPSFMLSVSDDELANWIKANKKKIWSFCGLVLVSSFFYLFLFDKLFNFQIKISLLLFVIVQSISIITDNYLIKKGKEYFLLQLNIAFNILYALFQLYILFFSYNLLLLICATILLYTLKIILQKIFLGKINTIPSPNGNQNISKQLFYLGINDTVGMIFKWIDKWVVLLMLSVSQFSVYYNATYEIPVFTIMVSAAASLLLVQMAKDKSDEKIKQVFNESIKFFSTIVLPTFCLFLLFHKEIFQLLFGDKYASGASVFLISIFIIPIRLTSFTTILQVNNKSNIILKGAIFDMLLAIIFMFLLYPIFKLNGLALACVLSTYFQVGYYLYHSAESLHTSIVSLLPIKKLVITLVNSLIIMATVFFLTHSLSNVFKLIIASFVCLLLISIQLFFYFKNEKKILINNIET